MRTASTKGAGPPTSYKHPEGTFWVSPPPVRHTATVLKKRKTETAKALMPRDLNAEVMQVDDSGSSSSEEVSPEPAGKNKIVNVQALKQMDEIIDILVCFISHPLQARPPPPCSRADDYTELSIHWGRRRRLSRSIG